MPGRLGEILVGQLGDRAAHENLHVVGVGADGEDVVEGLHGRSIIQSSFPGEKLNCNRNESSDSSVVTLLLGIGPLSPQTGPVISFPNAL